MPLPPPPSGTTATGGTLSGKIDNASVVGIKGHKVVATPPGATDILVYDITTGELTWEPQSAGAISSVTGSSGVGASPTTGAVVVSLNLATANAWTAVQTAQAWAATLSGTTGRFIGLLTAAPAAGAHLAGDFGIGVVATLVTVFCCKTGGTPGTWGTGTIHSSVVTTVTMGGDVTGTSTAAEVTKLLHKVITTLTNGKFLKVTSTKIVSATTPATTKVAMGGGVTGTSTACTVAKAPSGSLATPGTGVAVATTAGKAKLSATTVGIVPKTTSWTAGLTTAGCLVTMTNAGAKTVTLKKHATVAWPTGTVISFRQGGAGQLTVAAGATVTLHTPATFTPKTRVEYSIITVVYIGTNVWTITGDLAA